MSKEQKDLLKKLDDLNSNIEILAKVIAVNVGKETFFKEKKQKDQQIQFLLELGLPRNIIASIVVTTPLSVSVTKSQKKPKQNAGSEKPQPTKENSVEKKTEN